jgi:hypothetical protein
MGFSNVIREAKTVYYYKKNTKSDNKYKATWDTIKEVPGRQLPKIEVQDIKVKNRHITDLQEITDVYNDYFTLKEDKVITCKTPNRLDKVKKRNCWLNQNGIQPCSSFVFRNLSTKEISAIIKSIKTKRTCGYD